MLRQKSPRLRVYLLLYGQTWSALVVSFLKLTQIENKCNL